ncbi:MAG TPA: Hint domain-containing protein [Beijerinckiaceae bacterium]|nr:Hint domain-containing protein [Beijerinckiaceae bacterium]
MRRLRPIAATFALLGLVATAQAQLAWKAVTPSCLPVPGKMMRWSNPQNIPACHCPPKDFCPTTMDEWTSEARMPSFMAEMCCDRPYQCTVEWIHNGGGPCPSYFRAGPEKAEFCNHYKPLQTSDNKEKERRANAAKDLNACLAKKCGPLQKALLDAAPKHNTGVTSPNTKALADYALCEITCRTDAATALGIAVNTIDRSFYDTAAKLSTTFNGVQMPSRVAAFMQTRQLPSPWKVIPAGQGLESKLTCDDKQSSNICLGAMVQTRSTCGDCLAAGTRIQMADGSEKVIEDIRAGDVVAGLGRTNTVLELVSLDWSRVILHRINGAITLTADHPVMTTTGWKAIDFEDGAFKYGLQDVPKLVVGDTLVTLNGSVRVETIEAVPETDGYRTYNLRTRGNGTFIANGLIVKDSVGVD